MKLVKQQRFKVLDDLGDERNGCASMYEYNQNNSTEDELFAVSVYVEFKQSFVNRSIRTRAKAEKIYNQQLDKMKAKF